MGFSARKLLETRILTVASPAYLAAHARPAHPRDLLDHACIDYQDPLTGRPFAWEFRRGDEGLPVRQPARLMVSDVETMIGACCEGAGIAQVMQLGTGTSSPRAGSSRSSRTGRARPFPLYAIYPSRQHRAAKVRVFTEWCLTLLGGETSSMRRRRADGCLSRVARGNSALDSCFRIIFVRTVDHFGE